MMNICMSVLTYFFFFFFSLLNHTKKVVFTVRIIHSLPLMMSTVHVFFKDKMAAVGHLVGADQLPLPQLVSQTSVSILCYID